MPDDDDTHPLAHLGSQFADLNRELTSTRNDRVDVQRVVRFAARAVAHSTHCGLSLLVHRRAPRTIAATGSLPNQVDGLQYSTGEGPCLDAAKELTAVIADDLATDSRWPRFAPACVQATGIRSMLSVRLAIGGDDQGALNFYAPTAGAFTPSDEAIASIFAPFAALAVEQELREHEVENLQAALSSSRRIGAAVGIIMARRLVSSEEAFGILSRSSQELNRKLRDIAAEVEETGEVPDR